MKREKASFTQSSNLSKRLRPVVRRALSLSLCLIVLGVCLMLRHDRFQPVRAAAFAQEQKTSPDGVWQAAEESQFLTNQETRQSVPQSGRTVRLNREALAVRLSQAPLEFTEAARNNPVEITLPMPDGSFARFRIEESPVMGPGLAAQFPQIKTYQGRGVDDPTATLRFAWTPIGFHALLLSEKGTVYVTPAAKGETEQYISFNQADYQQAPGHLQCLVTEAQSALTPPQSQIEREALLAAMTESGSDGKLRTYRLAVAATGEYTALFWDPGESLEKAKADTLAAITTMVNFLNAIYTRELAIRFKLIDKDDKDDKDDKELELKIIYPYADLDPFTNGDPGKMRDENQETLDREIESANYDIGHVFGTNSGGQGFPIGQVCSPSHKAKGATGGADPGNPGDVGLVAHEFGHQFGANHTFNSDAPDYNSQRADLAAYEPGGGSTIMSYAGGCGAQQLQGDRARYFHAKSIEEILAHINGSGGSCVTPMSIGNTVPGVTVGGVVNIPKLTPFMLTAVGSDTYSDTLTYCWEEYDLGPASGPLPPDTDTDGMGNPMPRPILRSYNPRYSAERTFPSLDFIRFFANNPPATYTRDGCTYMTGEALPSITRSMDFRVTVRDNHTGGGAVAWATKRVEVDGGSGPFKVTSPNAGGAWESGATKTVTWDVAGTTGAPVSCSHVRIWLSTDGGFSFDTVLLDSTANDGSATVTVPALTTANARIKVEAVGNIFFDISDADFTICSAAPAVITKQPSDQTVCVGAPAGFSVGATGSFLRYQWSKDGKELPGKTESVLAIDSVSAGDAGSYQVKVSGSCGGSGAVVYSKPVKLTVNPAPSITSQPKAATVCAGRAASFSVAATGANLSYHWRKNGVPLPGANTATFSLATVSVADAGDYDVLVNSACGSLISQKARLTVDAGVSITKQPVPVATREGQPATFSVTATGANLRYQWRKNGSNITGATAASYSIATVSTAHAGFYSVAVSNGCETEVSASAELIVNTGIAISRQPASATRCAGQQVVFWVEATGSDLRYQWRGPDGGNIPGATASSYVIPAVSAAHAGSYYVVVYNGGGMLNSAKATLTVNPAMNISPASKSFPAGGGSGSVAVSGSGCAWTAVSNVAWLRYISGGGTGNGTVTYTVAANSGAGRSGTMTIAGRTFTVTQQAK